MSTQIAEDVRKPRVIKKTEGELPTMERSTKVSLEHKKGFWDRFLDQRVVIQMRGPQIIFGTFVEKAFDLLKLKDVSIKGLAYAVDDVEWIYVDPYSLSYFHIEGEAERYRYFPKKPKKTEEPSGNGSS